MQGLRATAFLLLMLAGFGCRATGSGGAPAGVLDSPFSDPELEYRFGEAGRYTYAENDRLVLVIEARDGRLYVNECDTGPYAPGEPVRILSRSELLVAGERRAIPPQPAPRAS